MTAFRHDDTLIYDDIDPLVDEHFYVGVGHPVMTLNAPCFKTQRDSIEI